MPGSRRSMAYPTDHLLAVIDDPTAAAAAGRALVAAGIRGGRRYDRAR